ncbi:hypothetical protein U9M48_044993 [Paspalum notatum var. saurae]|uniref:Late embryogenesis abundant protein LEA-2 subgroup domain-containing protein n=1 Tax=Paspalum notatum var. saurae TaxID=547442 RepID=A0AAQ3XI28_PASNO
MADDAKPMSNKPQQAPTPPPPFASFSAAKGKDAHGDALTPPAEQGRPRPRRALLRWACLGLAVAGAAAAAVMLALSLTVLKVRDPTLAMESVSVRWFSVRLDARGLRVNVTLAAGLSIRNPNYESMRYGASATEIFVDGVDGGPVGVGRAPPGEVPARGASRVDADVDVLVDRVGPAVVGEVLFGGGDVRLDTRTALDGRVSLLGGLYGRRTVRVAMRCRVALRVSAAVVVAGSPACVADFGR